MVTTDPKMDADVATILARRKVEERYLGLSLDLETHPKVKHLKSAPVLSPEKH